jgi:hypothetical protein
MFYHINLQNVFFFHFKNSFEISPNKLNRQIRTIYFLSETHITDTSKYSKPLRSQGPLKSTGQTSEIAQKSFST